MKICLSFLMFLYYILGVLLYLLTGRLGMLSYSCRDSSLPNHRAGGRKEMTEKEESMTITEVNRLVEWLKSKGLSSDEILDCLSYIGSPKVELK